MSQKSVPIADVGTPTGWSTPVWSKTNALKSGDPDYTASSSDPAGDTFVVQLGAFGVPPPTARPFRVKVRARATAGGVLLVTLLQGSTVIASRLLSPGINFEDQSFDLTETEIVRINYSAGTTTFQLEGKACTVGPCKVEPGATCATAGALTYPVNQRGATTAFGSGSEQWYSFTANATESAVLKLCANPIVGTELFVSLFSGPCATLTFKGLSSSTGPCGCSPPVALTNGQVYYLMVYSPDSYGSYNVQIGPSVNCP